MTSASAIVAGLGSAACFGAATAREHVVVSSGRQHHALDPRLLVRLARTPAWLLAFALELAAVVLQLLALRWGAVALVQPLLVLGLPLAVLLSARLKQQHLGGRAWGGIVLCAAGVSVVAVLLPGPETVLSDRSWSALAPLVGTLAAAVLVALLLRSRVIAGACAGVAAGVGAVALAVCGDQLSRPLDLLGSWPPYLMAVAGLLALQLGQAAFQDERLGAPLAAATLAEPVAAVVLSALTVGERLTSSASAQLACGLAVLGAAAGVLLLVERRG
jgi:drug/metabolite transporter (DMT)-like permease